jgi:glycosyltransferase involved in cell wall biosynthesis
MSLDITFYNRQIIVVMPAYNASNTLHQTYSALPHSSINEIILVDDGSRDNTIEIAKQLGLTVFVHRKNLGYGGNQKTCYVEALKKGESIIVMVHPDYQYDPTLLPEMIRPIQEGKYDVVFGSRMRHGKALEQGMPWWKYFSNIALTWLENKVFKLSLSEFHTGYRAYKSEVLGSVNFLSNSDSFIFDQEIVAQIVECKFRIGEISVPVRYFPQASSASFLASTNYGLSILWLLFKYILHDWGIFRKGQFISHIHRYYSDSSKKAESS